MPRKLTLKQCVEVIRYQKSHSKEGTRILAERFGCGRIQIQSIFKAKEEILKDFEKNGSEERRGIEKLNFRTLMMLFTNGTVLVGKGTFPYQDQCSRGRPV